MRPRNYRGRACAYRAFLVVWIEYFTKKKKRFVFGSKCTQTQRLQPSSDFRRIFLKITKKILTENRVAHVLCNMCMQRIPYFIVNIRLKVIHSYGNHILETVWDVLFEISPIKTTGFFGFLLENLTENRYQMKWRAKREKDHLLQMTLKKRKLYYDPFRNKILLLCGNPCNFPPYP